MDNPSNADLTMIEELLARMQQNPGQLYDDVDDEDDDDYEDDDDDDDDDDGYYGEHNIHTLLNTYGGAGAGGGEGGDMGEAAGNMQLPNAQTMNFLQGLLSMNNSNIPAMADIEAAIGGSMGGLGGMSGPMEGGSGEFHNAMQSMIPGLGSDMAGMLAGAFAGGMMGGDYGAHGGGATVHEEYDDDDDDDEDDDDDAVSDEEDEEDEEDDDDDDDDDDDKLHRRINVSDATLGAVGGLMAGGLLAGLTNNHQRGYPTSYHQLPALMPPSSNNQSHPSHQSHHYAGVVAPIGFSVPRSSAPIGYNSPSSSAPIGYPLPTPTPQVCRSPVPICSPPPSSIHAPKTTTITSTSLGSMSGGTVCKIDPLSALVTGMGGLALGAGIVSPIVSSLLGNSGGTAVFNKHNAPSSANSVIGNIDSFNSSSRTHPVSGVDTNTSIVLSQLSSAHKSPHSFPMLPPSAVNKTAQQNHESQLQATLEKDKMAKTKEECEDDKASLGSATGSETSGMGKSDTESVGKKTPTPLPPEGSESANSQEVGSCASIPDLASTTESMRDSDTDNHSEVHNVTANLSDLDNDAHEPPTKPPHVNPYAVGPLPVIIEHPAYGWNSMVGLDTAKAALKNLFTAASFPEVFEGTQGVCKGILLFGPSGSGKTCLARALAKESNNALFVGANSRYFLSHSPIDAIKLVRCMFEQARHQKPAVILFDEIEALCYPNNETALRAKDEILAQVRGLTTLPPAYGKHDPLSNNENILVLGTSNQPWLLEDSIRRMFAYNIHVKLPGEKSRHELFRTYIHNLKYTINEEEFDCLVSKSDGYSAADINTVIRQASHMVPLDSNGDVRVLTFDDLATVMTQYRCRFSDDLKIKYASYINAATHRADDVEDSGGKTKKDKKGVKKFSHKIAKSIAVAVLSVID